MSLLPLLFWGLFLAPKADSNYVTYTANPENIRLYYKHNGQQIKKLNKLATVVPGLKFATNASMFQIDYSPVGLYVENGKTIRKAYIVNNPKVNFGMQPQGVFAITKDNKAVIVPVSKMQVAGYKYAVQCAPMLVIDGKINPKLTKSESEYRRSGYGILNDGRVLFAISNTKVTFQEFARWFVSQGCTQAVYIDGVVSDYWTPTHSAHHYAEFAVLAGVF
jgi:uncharacterized protein YigE (DUF2233 family)